MKQDTQKLRAIYGQLIEAVDEALQGEKTRHRASVINAGISLLKMSGGIDNLTPSEDRQQEALARTLEKFRASGRSLPFPSKEDDDDSDEDKDNAE